MTAGARARSTTTAEPQRVSSRPVPPTIGRQERFARVASTNDVVRDWLVAGEPEICLARADEQTAGRGRNGRTWTAPPGSGLLVSVGFRPQWLPVDRVWRLAAIVSLAMADAAEAVSGLPNGTVRLKWPNDLMIVGEPGATARKLAGVLGETDGLGTGDPRAVVGIGVNVDWPAETVPPELAATMISLSAAAGSRRVDPTTLYDAFTLRLEARVAALFDGRFDDDAWAGRQVTTGRPIRLELPDGTSENVVARGVDPATGALIVADDDGVAERSILVGEIRHVRLGV